MFRLRLAAKILGAVAILVAVAVVVGTMGIVTLQSYKHIVDEMQGTSRRAFLAERVNGLVLAVVMDSRGIYMSRSRDESEKYAGPMLKNLDAMRGVLREWRDQVPPAQRDEFARIAAAGDEFIRFREELVRLSRESSLPEARTYGDNDDNRKVRGAFNDALTAASVELNREVADLGSQIDNGYTSRIELLIVLLAGGVLGGVALVTFVVIGRIARPLQRITATMRSLAAGDNTVDIPHADATDEVGTMAAAVKVFKDNALERERLRQAHAEERERADRERTQSMNILSDTFEKTVSAKVDAVETASHKINSTAMEMASRSENSGGRSLQVGEAAVITTERAADAADATRQLSQAVNEIARQVAQSGEVSRQAVDDVNAMAQRMSDLAESVKTIGEVVRLINDIASQTNLLALNATIEAARAGDAGKGFAVVAGEVKNLANQTAKATDDIARQINAVQDSTRDMAASIESVVSTIRSLDQTSATISGAVQEQETATRAIASNIEEVAAQAGAVSRSVTALAKSSAMSCAGTVRVIWSADSLTQVVRELSAEAESFISQVRQ
jgi:methyl-accepting chemotaxis protein